MPASTSKASKAGAPPFTMEFDYGLGRPGPPVVGPGPSTDELASREARRQYLHRKGETFPAGTDTNPQTPPING